MPATIVPSIPHYVPALPTKEELEWADIPIIDISKAATSEGRAELAPRARDAMRNQGFLYIINHGYSQMQNDRIFDIADLPFAQVPEEEKKAFAGNIKETGSYRGYKLRNYWFGSKRTVQHIDNGVHDQLEHYNLHRSMHEQQQHPKALQPILPEIREYAEHNHFKVLYPLLRILALGMELPEDTIREIPPSE
ncbi:hypothetical protein BC628DRAFT_1476307 [Trametes gibbosa]|nr:hypothetical protein BC628DRAFT_1476307 [Trametes gibbosa]